MIKNRINIRLFSLCLLSCLYSCYDFVQPEEDKELPYIGNHDYPKRINEYGKEVIDTIYHSIPAFQFINQNGQKITNEDFFGKVYIADFFFTHCPTICPKKTEFLGDIQKTLLDDGINQDQFKIASFTIDPVRDSIPVLKQYAEDRDIDTSNWDFIWGDQKDLYDLAYSYLLSVSEEPTADGGFLHTDAFILVDRNAHIRGVYDGTDREENQRLIEDVKLLIHK